MSGLAVKVVPQDVVYLNLVERDCPFEASTPGPASEPYDVYIVHHLTVALLLRSTLAVLTVFPRGEALTTASLTEAAYRHIQLVAKGDTAKMKAMLGAGFRSSIICSASGYGAVFLGSGIPVQKEPAI
jgi:hypothetical protein